MSEQFGEPIVHPPSTDFEAQHEAGVHNYYSDDEANNEVHSTRSRDNDYDRDDQQDHDRDHEGNDAHDGASDSASDHDDERDEDRDEDRQEDRQDDDVDENALTATGDSYGTSVFTQSDQEVEGRYVW